MLERGEQLGIEGGKAGQFLGVVAVVFRFAAGDGGNLTGIGHDDLMAQSVQQTADPGRVGATLQGDAQTILALEMPPQRSLGALYPPFLDYLSIAVQEAIVAVAVAQIKAHGHLRFGDSCFHLRQLSANLLHWLVSFEHP